MLYNLTIYIHTQNCTNTSLQIVLNSKLNGAWQTELRAAMPALVQGGTFKVQIQLLLNEFKIYVNGKVSKTVKNKHIFILNKYFLSMDFIYISIFLT